MFDVNFNMVLIFSATSLIITAWQPVLESIIDLATVLHNFNSSDTITDSYNKFNGPLDELINTLNNQISIAYNIFENLSKLKVIRSESNEFDVQIDVNNLQLTSIQR